MARGWVLEALNDVGIEAMDAVSIGAMIETPRAALVAAALSEHADFFSFGTNDLTQLTFAFSRDDVEVRLLPAYLASGILPFNPFEQLDPDGVGRLIRMTCDDARAVRGDIKIGICGEQAGDPASVRFLIDAGIDYLSCSPYRVTIARLAAAQALLDADRVPQDVLTRLTAEAPMPATERAGDDSLAPALPDVDDADAEFLVLHALKIKGFTNADTVSELSTVAPDRVTALLTGWAADGLCRHIEARDLWQLTADGAARHAALLPEAAAAHDGLRVHYTEFLVLNDRMKEMCTLWQLREGEPNDHTDAAYDDERLTELDEFNRECAAVLEGFAGAAPRFEAYRHRLAASAARAVGGETRMYTGVMCGSFHDVWMELHEDLIQLLGIDRNAEGSY
jgi:hypothetical protein